MINLGLVGKGSWGKNYIRAIKELSNITLSSENIKTHDYKDLFRNKNLDGVIIATPASTHYRIAKEFLKQGFDLLIEKPLALNSHDGLNLKEIADRKKRIVMVGHIYLYNPAFEVFKKYTEKIGKILFIKSYGMNYGPIRKDTSALWDWAPHDISMLLELSLVPSSIAAWKISDGMYSIKITSSKFSAIVFCGWMSPIKKRSMMIVGERGAVIFDDTVDKKILHIQRSDKNFKFFYPSFPKEEPLKREVTEFVSSIRNKKNPKSDLAHGILTIKIIEAAEKSIRQNGREMKF